MGLKYIEIEGSLVLLNDVLGVTPINKKYNIERETFSIIYKNNMELIVYNSDTPRLAKMGDNASFLFTNKPLPELRQEIISILTT